MSKVEEIRARVAATANPKPIPVDVPEWGAVFVKHLLIGDVDGIDHSANKDTATARGIAMCLCDEDGNLVFDAKNADDIATINGLKASSLQKINAAIEEMKPTADKAIDLGNVSPPATVSSST